MLERIAQTVAKKKIILPMPISVMKIAAALLDWIPAFPVTRDQLTMLSDGNVAPHQVLRQLIEREPTAFNSETLAYLRR